MGLVFPLRTLYETHKNCEIEKCSWLWYRQFLALPWMLCQIQREQTEGLLSPLPAWIHAGLVYQLPLLDLALHGQPGRLTAGCLVCPSAWLPRCSPMLSLHSACLRLDSPRGHLARLQTFN